MARKIHIYRFTFPVNLFSRGWLSFSVLTGTMSSVSTLYESELINTIRMSVVDRPRVKKMKGSVWNILYPCSLHTLWKLLKYTRKIEQHESNTHGNTIQQDVFHHILQQDVEYYDLHDNYDAMQYVSMAKNCLFWLLDTPNNLLQKVSHYYTVVILLNKSSVLFLSLWAAGSCKWRLVA